MATKRIKVICITVASVNGKTTNGSSPNIYTWSSKEDSTHFFSLLERYSLLVMGRKTYESAKHLMEHTPGRLRLILTKNPDTFRNETIDGQLEFTSEQPESLVNRLSKEGHTTLLLLGGSEINTSFLQKHLIDELLLTIEPKLFGTGTPLFAEGLFQENLQLLSMEKLNQKGTLLLKYKIV